MAAGSARHNLDRTPVEIGDYEMYSGRKLEFGAVGHLIEHHGKASCKVEHAYIAVGLCTA